MSGLSRRTNLETIRVMLITPDRRFGEVTSMLLSRRGSAVSLLDSPATLAERALRDLSEVAIIDAGRSLTAAARTAAAAEALTPPLGVVIVGNEPDSGLLNLRILPKWGDFEGLFTAVMRARDERLGRTLLVNRASPAA